MSKDRASNPHRRLVNREWGNKNRKREQRQRNLNNTARRADIADRERTIDPDDEIDWIDGYTDHLTANSGVARDWDEIVADPDFCADLYYSNVRLVRAK